MSQGNKIPLDIRHRFPRLSICEWCERQIQDADYRIIDGDTVCAACCEAPPAAGWRSIGQDGSLPSA